jgi:hypothetical protein
VATGHYFRSAKNWTLDRDDAYDFGLVSKAMKVAHQLRIRDLELVFSFESPEEAPATQFNEFLDGLLHNRKPHGACRHPSRSAALA